MGGKRRKLQAQYNANRAAARPRKMQQYKPDVLVNKKPGAGGSGVGPARPVKTVKPGTKKVNKQVPRTEMPTIPFERADRILLIGEGDLSFAASIIEHHGCVNVTATVLEKDEEELVEKYPHAKRNIAMVRNEPFEEEEEEDEAKGESKGEWNGIEDGDDDGDDEPGKDEPEQDVQEVAAQNEEKEDQEKEVHESDDDEYDDEGNLLPKTNLTRNNKLLFNIDATKLPPSLTRTRFTTIIFNFPHVGGKSTDINRQVRHNQSLLVSFFERALPALLPGGRIVVTLFEGEPYTLWNIRDLARHAGLAVDTSFRFQASAYPGYHHARTLGVVRNKKGEEGGGWRGEERSARTFVFHRQGGWESVKRKRKKNDDDSSDDED